MGPREDQQQRMQMQPISPKTTTTAGASAVMYFGGATAVGLLALLPFMVVPWLPKQKFGALPYMHTPQRKLRILFEQLLPRHVRTSPATSRQPPKRFIDLGSGMGEAVIEARKRGFEAHGVELNPTLFVLSSLNALWRAGPLAFFRRPRLSFSMSNMWSLRLGGYDVIMVFGVQSLMGRLTHKLRDEAKDGAVVVLYRFQLDLPDENQREKDNGGVDDVKLVDQGSQEDVQIKLVEAAEELSIYKLSRPRKEKP